MKRIVQLMLVTDDAEYAAAFTTAVAATQRGFAVEVAGGAAPADAEGKVLIFDGGQCAALEIHAGSGAAAVTVDKYAGCARICAEARAAYDTAHGFAGLTAGRNACREAELVSFVGVEGGAGTSSLALGLAGELSAYRGKSVLYLNFETFESPSLGAGGRMAARRDISAFLFAFLREGEGGSGGTAFVGPCIAHDDYGVMRFPPFAGLNRLRELNGEELGRFLAAVTVETSPDMVIADWGCGFGELAAEYAKASAATVLVTRYGGTKVSDGASFAVLADDLGLDGTRVIAAVNRAPADGGEDGRPHETTEGNRERGRTDFVEICDDPYAFDRDAGRISISLATAFGTGVKRLADIVLGMGGEDPCTDEGSAVFLDAAFAEGERIHIGAGNNLTFSGDPPTADADTGEIL